VGGVVSFFLIPESETEQRKDLGQTATVPVAGGD
jgi:hypothetical protein